MGDILGKRAGDPVEGFWWRGRRHSTFSQCVGGGLRANVVNGVLVGFGLEPIDGLDVTGPGATRHHLVLLWAAPLAGAAAAAGAVATSLVWRHRRAA
jgi:hypothetical protein